MIWDCKKEGNERFLYQGICLHWEAVLGNFFEGVCFVKTCRICTNADKKKKAPRVNKYLNNYVKSSKTMKA